MTAVQAERLYGEDTGREGLARRAQDAGRGGGLGVARARTGGLGRRPAVPRGRPGAAGGGLHRTRHCERVALGQIVEEATAGA